MKNSSKMSENWKMLKNLKKIEMMSKINKNNPFRLKMVVWVELNEKIFEKNSKIKKKL